MKKLFGCILGTLLFATILLGVVGCGQNPFDDGGEYEENKINISVAVLNESGELKLMKEFEKAYEAQNPTVNIRVQSFPAAFHQTMASYVTDPNLMPDIVWMPDDQHAPYTSAGHFVDLTDYYNNTEGVNLEDYYPEMIAATHYSDEDTGIWFAPRDYNKPVVIMNMDMIEAAGLAVPSEKDWNWDSFIKLCNDLREVMDNPTTEQRKVGLTPTSYPVDADLHVPSSYHSIVENFGGKLVDGDQVTVDSQDSLDAYKEIYPLVRDRIFTDPGTDAGDVFISRGSAMWISTRPKLPSINNVGINVDFMPLPTSVVGSGCSGYAISKEATKRVSDEIQGNTKTNAEYAWDFIKFIITEPGQEIFGKMGGGVPVLMSLAETGEWTKFISEDLNHAAFTSYPEKDKSMNVFNSFPPDKSETMRSNMNSLMVDITRATTWEGSPLHPTKPVADGNYDKLLQVVQARKQKILG